MLHTHLSRSSDPKSSDRTMSTLPTPISNNSYQIFPYFVGTDDGCESAIYLLPPSFTYKSPIQFTISSLYSGTGAITGTYENDDFAFSLSQQGSGPPTQSNVLANVTLKANNMWKCADSARSALMANFTDFLQNIESTFELSGILFPGATNLVGQQIADRMPAPMIESLFYRYAFSPGFSAGTKPYVDIRAGMRLLLETQVSQFLSPTSSMNGYISDGRFPLTIDSVATSNGRVIAFDAFLGNIKSPTITGASTNPVVAGGAIDLQPVSGQRKYWRLFYPQSIGAPSATGDQTTTNNITLIGTQTLAQLNTATTAYPSCDTSGTPPNICSIFLGRAIAIPEIPIWIIVRGQTALEYVPLGTTIANIIQRFTTIPLSPTPSVVSISRVSSASTSGLSAGITQTVQQGFPVNFSTLFNLPLIAGDSITFNF